MATDDEIGTRLVSLARHIGHLCSQLVAAPAVDIDLAASSIGILLKEMGRILDSKNTLGIGHHSSVVDIVVVIVIAIVPAPPPRPALGHEPQLNLGPLHGHARVGLDLACDFHRLLAHIGVSCIGETDCKRGCLVLAHVHRHIAIGRVPRCAAEGYRPAAVHAVGRYLEAALDAAKLIGCAPHGIDQFAIGVF